MRKMISTLPILLIAVMTQGAPVAASAVDRRYLTGSQSYCQKRLLDFEAKGLKAGTVMGKQYKGVKIHGSARGRADDVNAAMIFDSNNPTGEDYDLEYSDRGNILILSEDGDKSDPDDNQDGGWLQFWFNPPVRLDSLVLLDSEKGALVRLRSKKNKVIKDISVKGIKNNTAKKVSIGGIRGVYKLEIKLNGAGAVDDISYALPCGKRKKKPTKKQNQQNNKNKTKRPATPRPTTPRPTTPRPTSRPSNAPQAKRIGCGEEVTEFTEDLGQIHPLYEDLPNCNGIDVNLNDAAVSSVHTVFGKENMFIELWTKCNSEEGNTNTLLMYTRKIAQGQGIIENYKCEQMEMVICEDLDSLGAVEIDATPGTQYLLVSLHDGVGDLLSAGVVCEKPTPKPTKQPTSKPTPKFQPPERIGCGGGVTEFTRDLDQIHPLYEQLPACNGFDINLDEVEAASVHTVFGKEGMFIELWAKCNSEEGNINTLFLYSRTTKRGQDVIQNYECEQMKMIECDNISGMGALETDADAGTQYLLVSLHEKAEDIISAEVVCEEPTAAPTLPPTNKPSKKPVQPARKPARKPTPPKPMLCGERETVNTAKLNHVETYFENLPTCNGFDFDLDDYDASSAYAIHEEPGLSIDFSVKCNTNKGNENILLLYSVKTDGGSGIGGGFACDEMEVITCNKRNRIGSVGGDAEPGRHYVLLSLHKGLGDIITIQSKCKNPNRRRKLRLGAKSMKYDKADSEKRSKRFL